MLKLFNTLSRKVEEFVPLNPKDVGMYTCGPTVYGYQHIGNFRTMIFADVLLRTLMANGYKVKSVRNITDIDDKIIKNAKEKNLGIEEFSKEFTQIFFEDLNKLNILPVDVSPKATEHIGKMIKYIEKLIEKSFAYVEKDGSIYFDISKDSDYGKLSGLEGRTLKTGTRILSREARELRLSDEYDKENAQDFALWKSVNPDETAGYNSPWGRGRPGWHIECSVMSQEYLGDTFDIHLGGVDLIFPHHENEIAQSEGKTGQKFVNFFVHGEHLLVDGGKMSKSLKNFYTIDDIKGKGFDPLALRYLFLTAHYRDKLNFTWESLQAAQNALNNLREIVRKWEEPLNVIASGAKQSLNPGSEIASDSKNPRNDEYYQRFLMALNNDLNSPQAVAVMWELIKSDLPDSGKSATLLKMDQVLGLGLDKYVGKSVEIPEVVQKLINQREKARADKDFKKADEIRKEIKKGGYEIEDTPSGPKLRLAS